MGSDLCMGLAVGAGNRRTNLSWLGRMLIWMNRAKGSLWLGMPILGSANALLDAVRTVPRVVSGGSLRFLTATDGE